MENESRYFLGIALLSGSLLSSGLYLGSFHFFAKSSWLFFSLTIALLVLGLVKLVNRVADCFPPLLRLFARWLHSLVFEALSIALATLFRPLGFSRRILEAVGSKTGRPILLIHGYLQNGSNWTFFKRMLSSKGLGPIYTLNLTHPFRSISDYGHLVAQKAAEIENETGESRLILIGHSMGGLVSSWYASKIAPKGKVTDVITIGSPLAGTILASIALGPNGREMRRGSQFIKKLQEAIRQNKETRFYHVASKADQIILPQSSALMGFDPDREFLLDDIGHMTLIVSPRVAHKIAAWLL